MKMLIPAIALLSTTAMAADLKWNVEGRFDYVNSKVTHEAGTAANNFEEKRGEFDSNIIRLNATYTISDSLSGRFRYRLSTSQETLKQNRDLSFQNVDFFYVDHKNQWFTSRLGKHAVTESLGREFFTSGTDYNVTMGSVSSNAPFGSTKTKYFYTTMNTGVYNALRSDADLYHVGAAFIYSPIQDSTITLDFFNPGKGDYTDQATNNDNSKNNKLAYGAYYSGSFLNKMIQPTIGYTVLSIAPETNATTSTPDAKNKLFAVGLRSEVAGVVADVDWKQYKRDNTVSNPTSATNTENKITSLWVNVGYTWEMLTPFFNYVHDKYDQTADATNTAADYKRNAFSAGLQVKPFKENNFRYHVSYSHDVKETELLATATTADKKVTANVWAAGIKFDL